MAAIDQAPAPHRPRTGQVPAGNTHIGIRLI